MTYHNAKKEASIPLAKIKIFSENDICKTFLRDVYLFSEHKNWATLVGRIIEIGGELEFHYDIGVGYRDSSVKMTELEMRNME